MTDHPDMPEFSEATKLTAMPHNLSHVRDIDWYDGPLESEFICDKGNTFFFFWLDSDNIHNRWVVSRVTPEALSSYEEDVHGEEREWTSKEYQDRRRVLMASVENKVLVCDLDNDAKTKNVWEMQLEDLIDSHSIYFFLSGEEE